jgi:LysR family transcriptional regulator for metE and metH
MQIDIRHLQLVEAITAEGTVTRAAERLNVTQSALSHQMREIEDRLRTPLFLRVNRRLILSPAGERVLDTARRVLGEISAAEEDIARLSTAEEGTIRISSECYTCYNWLPPLLARFRERYPKVDIEIRPEVTRSTLDALLDGKIDLALIHRVKRASRLCVTPLFTDEIVVITPPGHRLARRKFITAEELADEHLFLHSPAAESYFYSQLKAEGVKPRTSTVTLTEAIVELVKAGLGVSALPRWTVEEHLRRGSLAAIRFTRGGLLRRWAAASLRSAEVSPAVSHFADLIQRHWSSGEREAPRSHDGTGESLEITSVRRAG